MRKVMGLAAAVAVLGLMGCRPAAEDPSSEQGEGVLGVGALEKEGLQPEDREQGVGGAGPQGETQPQHVSPQQPLRPEDAQKRQQKEQQRGQ